MSGMWSDEYDLLLRELYPTNGANIPELSQFTRKQIQSRAHVLGIKRVYWTDEEIDLVRKFYPTCGTNIPQLNNKSSSAISCLAVKLGISSNSNWTEEEDRILRSKYPICGTDIPELVNRTVSSIGGRAKKLGLKYDKWTPERLELLKRDYPKYGADIPQLLEVFSSSAIRARANTLGIASSRFWTDDEVLLLKEFYAKYGTNIPGLDKSPVSISKKARSLGLLNKPTPSEWTEDEIDKLRSSYMNGETPVFSRHTEQSVRNKAKSLGLTLGKTVQWSIEEEHILREYYQQVGPSGVVALLSGRTYSQVVQKANKLGLKYGYNFRDRSKDVLIARDAGTGFVYCTCAVCGRVFLTGDDEYKTFSHDSHVCPVPDGWRTDRV